MNIKIFGRIMFISVKNMALICLAVISLAAFLFFKNVGKRSSEESLYTGSASLDTGDYSEDTATPAGHTEYAPRETVAVYIVGAVNRPDIYYVEKGILLHEVIDLAGGLCENADRDNINLAIRIEYDVMLKILTSAQREKQERKSALVIIRDNSEINGEAEKDIKQTGSGTGKININNATKEQLMSLPGIGEVKAESIVKYRETNGAFKRAEDIMNVSGIKEAGYESIKDLITVD